MSSVSSSTPTQTPTPEPGVSVEISLSCSLNFVQICNNPSSDLESKSQRSQKQFLIEDYIPPAKVTKEYFYQPSTLVLTWFQMQKSSHDLTHTYCWDSQLAEPSFVAAPVSAFSHAPMADGWDNIIIGMKVNILNTCLCPPCASP